MENWGAQGTCAPRRTLGVNVKYYFKIFQKKFCPGKGRPNFRGAQRKERVRSLDNFL